MTPNQREEQAGDDAEGKEQRHRHPGDRRLKRHKTRQQQFRHAFSGW